MGWEWQPLLNWLKNFGEVIGAIKCMAYIRGFFGGKGKEQRDKKIREKLMQSMQGDAVSCMRVLTDVVLRCVNDLKNCRVYNEKIDYSPQHKNTLERLADACRDLFYASIALQNETETRTDNIHCCIKIIYERDGSQYVKTLVRSQGGTTVGRVNIVGSHDQEETPIAGNSAFEAILGINSWHNKAVSCFVCTDTQASRYETTRGKDRKHEYNAVLTIPLKRNIRKCKCSTYTTKSQKSKETIYGFVSFDTNVGELFKFMPDVFGYKDAHIDKYYHVLHNLLAYGTASLLAEIISPVLEPKESFASKGSPQLEWSAVMALGEEV